MTQDDGGYELRPAESGAPVLSPSSTVPPPPDAPPAGSGAAPKPGEPGWVPPVPVVERAEEAGESEEGPDPDVEKHKGIAVLAYICFLIPLVAAPNSKFARYHGNQGLLLFILLVVVCVMVAVLQGAMVVAEWALHAKIPILYGFFVCGLTVLQPALLMGWIALMIMGIINAANGLRKPLPGVGHWELIK